MSFTFSLLPKMTKEGYMIELEDEVKRRKAYATELLEIAVLKCQGVDPFEIVKLKKLPLTSEAGLDMIRVEDGVVHHDVSKIIRWATEQLEKVAILETEIESVKLRPDEVLPCDED